MGFIMCFFLLGESICATKDTKDSLLNVYTWYVHVFQVVNNLFLKPCLRYFDIPCKSFRIPASWSHCESIQIHSPKYKYIFFYSLVKVYVTIKMKFKQKCQEFLMIYRNWKCFISIFPVYLMCMEYIFKVKRENV